MRSQTSQRPVSERIKNFLEVTLGFSKEAAEKEAVRCLQCKDPACVKGCPVKIDIPAFIKLIKDEKQKEALLKIKEKNALPAVCGRVCPQEDQCEAACVLNNKKIPINIGALERYAAEAQIVQGSEVLKITAKGIRVAVVGAGPSGLTCAADLAKMGYGVTLFESLHVPGGVLVYGIPEFRLPKHIIESEVEAIRHLGVDIKTDFLIGATLSLEDLFAQGFKAIFLGLGAGLPQFLNIPGESLAGIYSANEFLTRVNLMKAYLFPAQATPVKVGKKVAVIGGGNVAMDSARCALRLGSAVTLVYRRTEDEMPARREETVHAKEEGVGFQILTQPVRILGDEKGFVKGLECIKMELGEPDSSGRRRPVEVKDSLFTFEADTVIIAIGQNPNPLLPRMTAGLKTKKDGTIEVDEKYMTSLKGVFAGGDIITGADTVIAAMGAGKKAAFSIDSFLKRKDVS